jgi:hypothetical protein
VNTPRTWPRRILVTAGALLAGYAVLGALTSPDIRPVAHLRFLIEVLVANDGVLMPLAIGVGALIGRVVPAAGRPSVRVAAFLSLVACALALPMLLSTGRAAGNSSLLPLRYGRNLALVLAALWVSALLHAGYRAWIGSRTPGDPEHG